MMVKCEDCVNKKVFNQAKKQYCCSIARPQRCVNVYKPRRCTHYRKKKSFADWLFGR